MSTRQLFSPSRSGSSRDSTVFQLQPPPNRYKENRRCRVLSKKDDDSLKSRLQASLVHIRSPLSPRMKRGSSMVVPLLEEAILPAGTDDNDSDSDTTEREHISQGDHGGIITSPVKNEVRNSAFFGEACVWSPQTMTGYETSMDKCLSASRTSSFHSIARTVTTFGAVRKRNSSLQSIKSPTQRQKNGSTGSPSSNGETAHTVLPMSPLSPFALKTAPSLDTPAELHFNRINTHLVLPICEHGDEPLSATLKRLGAARESIDLLEEEQEDTNDVLYSQSTLTGWEQSLAERVASQKQAVEASKANQEALQHARGLFEPSPEDAHKEYNNKALRYSWLERDPALNNTDGSRHSKIQSTARGVARRNLRSSISSISTVLANHIFKQRRDEGQVEERGAIALATIEEDHIARPGPAAPTTKGDGWGGLRPRSSWFPSLTFGPLVSPPPVPSRHLRPLQLLQSPRGDRNEWIDEVEASEKGDRQVIEEESDPIRKLRVRFPSYLPKPSRDRHPSVASSSDSLADQGTIVTYTRTSAEGRPTTAKQSLHLMREHGGLLLAFMIVVGMVAFIAVVGTQAVKNASTPNIFPHNNSTSTPTV